MLRLTKIRGVFAAALVAGAGFAGTAAHAITDPAVLASPKVGEVAIVPPVPPSGTAYIECGTTGDCTGTLFGWVGNTFGAGSFGVAASQSRGDVFNIAQQPTDANNLAELRFVSGNPTGSGYAYVDGAGASVFSQFLAAGSYIKLKFGNFNLGGPGDNIAAFFRVDQATTITYRANGEQGAGVSFLAAIPLPAAAWLMIAGLGGLGFVARRRNTKVA
jgi:hypothetical protein